MEATIRMGARKGGRKNRGEGKSVRVGRRSDNMHSPCLQIISARTLRLSNESDTPTASHSVQEIYSRQKEYNDLGSLRGYVPSATIPRSCIPSHFPASTHSTEPGERISGGRVPGCFPQ